MMDFSLFVGCIILAFLGIVFLWVRIESIKLGSRASIMLVFVQCASLVVRFGLFADKIFRVRRWNTMIIWCLGYFIIILMVILFVGFSFIFSDSFIFIWGLMAHIRVFSLLHIALCFKMIFLRCCFIILPRIWFSALILVTIGEYTFKKIWIILILHQNLQ